MNLRDYRPEDKAALAQLAVDAFAQYQQFFQPWEEFKNKLIAWTSLAETAQLIVVEEGDVILGAVALIPPKSGPISHFPPDWAAIRMLVVNPNWRGNGIGKALTLECITRAKKMQCPCIGLHTSPIMKVALAMYLKMGFVFEREIDRIHHVPYAVYRLDL